MVLLFVAFVVVVVVVEVVDLEVVVAAAIVG